MHKEIGKIINHVADAEGTELTPQKIHEIFRREYLERTAPIALQHFKTTERDSTVKCEVALTIDSQPHKLTGSGNGPIDAFVRALGTVEASALAADKADALVATPLPKFDVLNYSEHSLGQGAKAQAVSYIQIKTERGHTFFGAGIDTNIELASIKAIVSALNRALAKK